MKFVKAGAMCLTTLVLVVMVSISVAATPGNWDGGKQTQTYGYGHENKLVQSKNVDFSTSFTLEELADSPLVEYVPLEVLIELIPSEILDNLDPNTTVGLDVDGKLCVVMVEKHRCGATSVCLNAVWQGTIAINISGLPEIVLDIKMAQLQLSAVIPDDAPEALDLKATLHVHGKAIIGGASGEVLDIRHQAVLCIDDGEITKLKISPCHCYWHCHGYWHCHKPCR